jgi:hypothetical protein
VKVHVIRNTTLQLNNVMLIRIKASILYMMPTLLTAASYDTMLNVVVTVECFPNTSEAITVKKMS